MLSIEIRLMISMTDKKIGSFKLEQEFLLTRKQKPDRDQKMRCYPLGHFGLFSPVCGLMLKIVYISNYTFLKAFWTVLF